MTAKKTMRGSPVSPCWDAAWIDTVSKTERDLGRRICGARTHAGTPCLLKPNHENGRCKFHGGFDLTGAQPGNRNAVIHGLYSRALRVCGPQCPLWDQCPCAGEDVAKLTPAERPTCPYEATEYETAVTDLTAYAGVVVDSDPMCPRMVHQAALLHVMVSRAFIALRDAPLTIEAGAKSETCERLSQKTNPLLDAYFRLSREFRTCLEWLKQHRSEGCPDYGLVEHQRRATNDTSLDPDAQAQLDITVNPPEHRATWVMRSAVAESTKGYDRFDYKKATDLRERAKNLVPGTPDIWDVKLPHELEEEAKAQKEKEAENPAPG